MQYFAVHYEAGFFCGGTAYMAAVNRAAAKGQVRRARTKVQARFDMRTLRRITQAEYLRAKGHKVQ